MDPQRKATFNSMGRIKPTLDPPELHSPLDRLIVRVHSETGGEGSVQLVGEWETGV